MKRVLNILALSICLLWTVGCSDSDSDNGTLLKIVSQDVEFTCQGGEGTIVVSAPETVTAKSSQEDWCTVTVNGSTITVNVERNPELLSRAAQVEVKYLSETISVPVNQLGQTKGASTEQTRFTVGNTVGETFEFEFVSDLEVEVGEHPSWLDVSILDKTVTVEVLEINPEYYAIREGQIKLISGGIFTLEIEIEQEETVLSYDDFLGNWKLNVGAASNTGLVGEHNVTVMPKVEGTSYTVSGLRYDFELQYNNGRPWIQFTQTVGTYTTGGVTYDAVLMIAYINPNTGNAGINSSNSAAMQWNVISWRDMTVEWEAMNIANTETAVYNGMSFVCRGDQGDIPYTLARYSIITMEKL